MHEILVGLFAIGVGAVFTFYGWIAMRILFPLWGLVAGYWFGAQMVSSFTNDTFFGTTLGIVVGIVCGLVAAVLAYLFYAVAVVMFMGIFGYWLGAGLLIWVGINPGFLTFAVGFALGIVFVLAGLFLDVPKYFLLFFTAFAGAALMISGLLVMGNVASIQTLEHGPIALMSNQSWIWQVLWLVVGVAGLGVQLTNSEQEQLAWADAWKEA